MIGRVTLFACGLALAIGATVPSFASAARPLTTGLAGVEGEWGFTHAVRAKARFARDTVSWRQVASARPAQPRNPADPAYDWSSVDGFVNAASAHEVRVLLTITRAPDWAEGPGKENEDPRYSGTWKPDAQALGDFATALARRYSGSFRDPGSLLGAHTPLPRVRYFEVWSEPNRTAVLEPQWRHGKPKSPKLYRRMANAVYDGVKSVHAGNKVVGPGLGPYGDPRNKPSRLGARMRPVFFLRQLLCLKGRKALKPKKHCKKPVHLDVISHHPINVGGGPEDHATQADNATSGDLDKVTRVVRAAEKAGTIRPRKRHRDLWVTEFWWVSDPPNRFGVPPKKQARWVAQSLYVWWRDGASVAIQQPLSDSFGAGDIGGGLFFANHKPKPSFKAFMFPFVTDRKSRGKVKAWGKAPKNGKLKIQVKKSKKSGWKTKKRVRVKRNEVFKKKMRLRGKAKARAKIGKTKSLVWKQKS